jgi:hypothetical protein
VDEDLFHAGATVAIAAQGGKRPTDKELEEIMTTAKWDQQNCYFEPIYMSDAFALDRLFARCGGMLPYQGPLRRQCNGEEYHSFLSLAQTFHD